MSGWADAGHAEVDGKPEPHPLSCGEVGVALAEPDGQVPYEAAEHHRFRGLKRQYGELLIPLRLTFPPRAVQTAEHRRLLKYSHQVGLEGLLARGVEAAVLLHVGGHAQMACDDLLRM
ncbi:hypothetical protein AB0P17_23705 [Streptomyces sp. NPDC088124]|uniref:hypothetical protein n=1 Tax=Streptomyces sp. NPDC088124 TaxID=3154654 RepID=UPI00341FC495